MSQPTNCVYPANRHWIPASIKEPIIAEGIVKTSEVSTNDFPFDHQSHDWTFDVKLDPKYMHLNNPAANRKNGPGVMEMEWETKFFPSRFWPEPSDKVWMMGRHVLDCGHPPARTEIHPPEAVAFTRPNQIESIGHSSYNFTRTYIYISGHGGYYNSPIGGKNYEFDIPLPSKPGFMAVPYASTKVLFGSIKPVLTIVNPNNSAQGPKVHVLYNLSSVIPSIDNKFGAIVSTGWIGKGLEENFQTLYVTFDSIKINKDHDFGWCPSRLHPLNRCPGDWKLWVDVNGDWRDLLGGDISNPRSHTTISDETGKNTLNLAKTIEASVPSKGTLTIRTTGWESDAIDNIFGSSCHNILTCIKTAEVIGGNDVIGRIDKHLQLIRISELELTMTIL